MIEFRTFRDDGNYSDYWGYAGAEPFNDGSPPLIGDMVLDGEPAEIVISLCGDNQCGIGVYGQGDTVMVATTVSETIRIACLLRDRMTLPELLALGFAAI